MGQRPRAKSCQHQEPGQQNPGAIGRDVCANSCAHVCICVYLHMCIYSCLYILCTYMCTCIISVCAFVHTCVHLSVCICAYLCALCAWMCACMTMCAYIHVCDYRRQSSIQAASMKDLDDPTEQRTLQRAWEEPLRQGGCSEVARIQVKRSAHLYHNSTADSPWDPTSNKGQDFCKVHGNQAQF